METLTIDASNIRFDANAVRALNVLVMFLMFGIALDIRPNDFLRLVRRPRVPLVGLLSEYVYLPLLTIAMIALFQPAASIALGMILLSVCPGGSVSNYMVYISRSNAALSILLTAVTTLGATVLTPFAFSFWSGAGLIDIPAELATTINVDVWDMILSVAQVILIPLAVGMLINVRFPAFKTKIERWVKIVSMVLFLGFVLVAVLGNIGAMKQYLGLIFVLVLVHNALAMIGGYTIGKLFRLSEPNARTVAIETGIQNTALGMYLIFNFFDGNGGMLIVLAWWGIWHLLSGFGIALWWRRSAKKTVGSVA